MIRFVSSGCKTLTHSVTHDVLAVSSQWAVVHHVQIREHLIFFVDLQQLFAKKVL